MQSQSTMAINRNDSPTNRKPAAQFTVFDEKAFVDLPSSRVNNPAVRLLHTVLMRLYPSDFI